MLDENGSMGWNGLGVGLSNLWRIADGESRSISPENFTGEKGRPGSPGDHLTIGGAGTAMSVPSLGMVLRRTGR